MSDSNAKLQIETTNSVINEIGVEDTDSLLVFNKIDKVNDPEILESDIQRHPEALMISSKNGTGIDLLQNAIIRCYEKKLDSYKIVINYKQAKLIQQIRKCAVIVQTDYEDTLIRLNLRLPPGSKAKVQKLLKDSIQAEKN